MIVSFGYAQPSVSAPTPTHNASDVISVFSGAYSDVGSDFFPGWGQGTLYSNYVVPASSPTDNVIMYSNLDYEGVQFNTPINAMATGMTTLHFDIWTPDVSPFNIYLIAGGENAVTVTPSLSGWNSYDLVLATEYPARDLSNIIQFKFEKPGFAYHAEVNSVYLDNIYFWKPAPPAGTPVITGFSVPTKTFGDPDFSLTAPMSNSPGAFSYTSSDPMVATVAGSTVTIIGVGTSVITANQAASGTYLAGSTTANLVVLEALPPPSPTPAVDPSTVIALYGETYPISNYAYDFGAAVSVDLDPSAGVNNALKVNFDDQGYGQGFSVNKDVTAMQYVHFDYYTTNSQTFSLHLISASPTFEAVYKYDDHTPIVFDQWVSVNIPLSYFTGLAGFNADRLFQFKLGTLSNISGGHKVYFDNLYLTSVNLATSNFEKSGLKMYPNPATTNFTIDANANVEKVSVYNLLGQEVISKTPNNQLVTLDITNLQVGVYVVKVTVNGNITTSRIIKE